jgi:superfamily II DNA or RNA helicase
MYFEVGEKIYAKQATKDLLDWCRENLVLDNPDYHKKLRMGLWLGNTQKQIYLYEKDGADLIIPFGCIERLRQKFPKCVFYSRIKEKEHEGVRYNSGINLYPYQRDAVKSALKHKNGIIVMPCGAGKTQTALEIISVLGKKTLWLTHTQDLLNQSMNRAKSVLNCHVNTYGTITGGKVNIGSGITFATVQTLSKIDLRQYTNTWDVVIVDECHKAVGSPTKVMQFYKVLSNLSCRYKFGITATPKRADGLEVSMFALLGDIIHEVSREEVADTTCEVRVKTIQTRYMPDISMALAGDGTINYAGLVEDLIHNQNRFEVVMRVLMDIPYGQPVIVLANRVEYLQKLCEEYKERQIGEAICLSTMGNTKSAKQARKQALGSLNDGELDCIFATYQLAKEGLDVPNLRYVVFATPEKDETTVMQAAGRVGRKADGKEYGTVIDFVDDFGMYKGWAKKRINYYKKLGYIY